MEVRTADASTRRSARAILAASVLFALVWKFGALGSPPYGEHAWRDADGLGIARGFVQDGWNLLVPHVAERGATPGVCGMELPLVDWIAALFLRALGDSFFAARLCVWLCLPLLALGMFALSRRLLRDPVAASVAAACLVLQPLVLVFSRKLMPEVPMLTALVWGLALAHDALAGGQRSGRSFLSAAGAGVLLAVAATLKPTGAAAGVPIALWALQARRTPGTLLRAALIATVPILATAAWIQHAHALDQRYGLHLFKLEHDWLEWTHLLFRPTFLSVVFGRILHLYLLWPTVALLALRWRDTVAAVREHREVALWALAALALVIVFGSHNYQHSYYAMGLLPPLCLLLGAFSAQVTMRLSRPHLARSAALAVFAVTAAIRTLPRFPPLPYDAVRVEKAAARLPAGLTVATDGSSPVISLSVLGRVGWTERPEALTPERIEALRRQGARVLIDSSFGGRLPAATVASLPPPVYQDDQVRAFRLEPR